MTRKDYILIAEALRIPYLNVKRHVTEPFATSACVESHLAGQLAGINLVAEEIADSLARDNGRFVRAHFLAVVRGERELNSKPRRGEQ